MIHSAKFLITSTFIAISGLLPSAGTITAAYLPHGPANPTNPAWGQTSYRDIPWWFHDDNSVWATGTPGAADAYDISAV